MAWENRGGSRYYYRKVRRGRRVVSEYGGSGYLAELLAERDQQDREERAAARRKFDQVQAEGRAQLSQLDQVGELVGMLTRAALLAAGYHSHRGEWRKARDGRATGNQP